MKGLSADLVVMKREEKKVLKQYRRNCSKTKEAGKKAFPGKRKTKRELDAIQHLSGPNYRGWQRKQGTTRGEGENKPAEFVSLMFTNSADQKDGKGSPETGNGGEAFRDRASEPGEVERRSI